MATRSYRGGNWRRSKSDATMATYVSAGPEQIQRALQTPAGEHDLDRSRYGVRTLDDMTAEERAELARIYKAHVAEAEPEKLQCLLCGKRFTLRPGGRRLHRCGACRRKTALAMMAKWKMRRDR